MFNVEKIRKDFPILETLVNEKKLVYLDNAATSQKPIQVIEKITEYYNETNSNIFRGNHYLSEKATEESEIARKKTAKFINAKSEKEIIFTRNATESINLLMNSLWRQDFFNEGDEIITTIMEHHANFVPWQQLAKEKKLKLKVVNLTENFELDLNDFKEKLTPKTKLVAFTQCSNVLGTITQANEIIKLAHDNNSLVCVDAAQSAPHMKIDVQKLNADFLSFSSHKMLGPTGIGVLYGKKELLEKMPPFLFGGEMISEVNIEKSSWSDLPLKFEAGTPNIAGQIAFGTAIDYLESLGMDNVLKHEQEIGKFAFEKLNEISNLKVYGPEPEKKSAVFAFTINGVNVHDIAGILDSEGIAIRTGAHCAHPLNDYLGVQGTARASFYFYNTNEEVELLAETLTKISKLLSK